MKSHNKFLTICIWTLHILLVSAASGAITPGSAGSGGIPPQPSTGSTIFNSDACRVEKQVLESTGRVGETVRYRIRIQANDELSQVRILETIPAGVNIVETSPAPGENSANARLWVFSNMARGTTQDIIISVVPDEGGWHVTNTKVAIVPVVYLSLFAGSPKLELEKIGPAQAELGDDINFQLIVRNVGTATAPNVIVTDTLPAGLYSPDRSPNVITHKLGDLPAGESRIIDVPVKAAVKGEWENRANAYSTHLVQAHAVAPVSVVESKLSLTKSAPERAFIFGEATCVITGRNDGETVLRGTRLADTIPPGTQVVRVSDGGEVIKNQVIWTLPDLPPGQQFIRTVILMATAPLVGEGTATATISTGRQINASARTEWEGAPGVLTEIFDDVDPIRVGGRVVYTVKITNQSPLRSLTSNAIVNMSPRTRILDVKGAKAAINGQQIVVNDITLKPKGTLIFRITAEAVEPGLGGVHFEFGSGFLPRPVVKEETTYIY